MKKILGLTATYPIHPRLKKLCESLQKKNREVIFLSFNLENKKYSSNDSKIINYKFRNKIYKYVTSVIYLYKFIKSNEIDKCVCRGIIPFFS